MKKFSLLLFTAFNTGNNDRLKAFRIYFLAFLFCCIGNSAFAQVTVTPANNGTAICGPTPACFLLNPITVAEGGTGDFNFVSGTPDRITIIPPTGWQFCTASTLVFGSTGADITSVANGGFSSTALTIVITTNATLTTDQITLSGLQVQPLTPSAQPGYINASATTGVPSIALGSTGADFGDLGLFPGVIAGNLTICYGQTTTLSDPTSPGVWSNDNTNVATIDPILGTVTTVQPTGGTTQVTYSVTSGPGGCSASAVLTVNPNPGPFTGVHDVCQLDSFTVSDAATNGIYSSTLVTARNLGSGVAVINSNLAGPGPATLTYTLFPSTCFRDTTFMVNKIPDPIIDPSGTYELCVGSMTTLTDATGGGTWSSSVTTVATMDLTPGNIYAVSAGTTRITYTLGSTGCFVDTVFRVNPIPGMIHGIDSMCVGGYVVLSDSVSGGSWTSSNVNIAAVGVGDTINGVGAGVATITYTLVSGCFTTFSVTVNPVPVPITGPPSLCEGDSVQLNETLGGGTWSVTPTTVATIDSVTGIIKGTNATATTSSSVTVTYILPTGCSAIFPLTINPLPDSILPTTQVVCQMQSITLSDGTPGGTWTSFQPPIATVVPATGVVTGVGVGTTTITYTLGTGCFATVNVTVNQLDSITGPSRVCQNDSITLSDATFGGTWYSSNTTIATIDPVSGVVVGILNGTTVISWVTSTGCTTTKTITVDPGPGTITGPPTVCQGLTINLSDAPINGTWISTDTFIATIAGGFGNIGVLTADSTGITTPINVVIQYVLPPAGCTSSFTVTVNPRPAPITGPSSVCQGDSVTLSDPSFPGGKWTATDTFKTSIDSISGVVIGKNPGVDSIYYTFPTGCTVGTPFKFTVNPIVPITAGHDTVCTGSQITSLSDATPGGTWSSAAPGIATINTTTGVLTGTNPGPNTQNVVITYSLPTGCFATYTITVNPQPTPMIPSTLSVCQGQLITITDATPGGVWANHHNNIDTITNISGGITVGGVSPGTDTITYTLPLTGCAIGNSIVVNPLLPITGNTPPVVCVGATITLSDATPGGGTWASSNTAIATVVTATGVVTGVHAGVDTISFIAANTGCTITYTISVNPPPDSILGIMPLCAHGDTIRLSDSSSSIGGTWSATPPALVTIDQTGLLTTSGITGGVAHVTYTLATTGCMITATVLVNPLPQPIVGPINICIFDSTIYTDANTPGTWTSSFDTVLNINDTTGKAHALDTGTTVLTYVLTNTGCAITDTVHVRPLPNVRITPSHPGVLCRGATDTLTATGADTLGTYFWSPATALSSTGPDSFTYASPVTTITYTVLATTQYVCKDTASITIVVDTALNHLMITGKDSMCQGECDQLLATGGVDSVYLWTPATGLNFTNIPNPIACPVNTTRYNVIAVDFLGCVDSAQFTVTVNPKPVLVVDPNPTILCKRTPLTVTVSGAYTGGTYTWTPNLFISCDTCATVVLTDTANIIYEVAGTTIYGCKDSIPVIVSVLDTNVNSISPDSIICIGKSVQLAAYSQSLIGNLDVPTFIWSPAESLNDPTTNRPIATPTVTTVYTVIITENVCFKDTERVQITVEPLPAITITPPTATVIAGTAVQLLAAAPNVVVSSFAWSPSATLSCDTCDNPVATPVSGSTTYTVTVTSNYGCINDNTVTINLFCDNTQIFIPNTFTPNGDGVNDRFYVSGKGISIITRLAVYNRWGQLLFEAHNINVNDPGAGWDGTYKGYVLEPDVFIYEVSAECELGQPFTYKGDVSIVR